MSNQHLLTHQGITTLPDGSTLDVAEFVTLAPDRGRLLVETSAASERLAELDKGLRFLAAKYSGTPNAETLDQMSESAQDLYQKAILIILEQSRELDTKTYILQLAEWRMLNENKKITKYRMHIKATPENQDEDDDEFDDIDFLDGFSPTPEKELIRKECNKNLLQVVRGLPESEQIIVQLMAGGFDIPEIAEQIGIAYNTCYKRIRKIRESFRQAGISPRFITA